MSFYVMKKLVEAFITTEQLLDDTREVVVAFSGGADSMALLHLMKAMAREGGFQVSAVHIHHGIRTASDDEMVFARQLCASWQVPLMTRQVTLTPWLDQGMSTEMAAREARYQVFGEVLESRDCVIALGHHRDDQAETVLLNLFRGAGLQGLKGMRPRRGGYIRPLLPATKAMILAYCEAEGLTYVTDDSNRDTRYRRNWLRETLIPEIEATYGADIRKGLWRTAQIAREEEDLLDALAEGHSERVVGVTEDGRVWMDIEAFNALTRPMQRRVARKAISRSIPGLSNVSFDHIEGVIALLTTAGTGKVKQLPGGWQIRRGYSKAILEQPAGEKAPNSPEIPVDMRRLQAEKHWAIGPWRFRLFCPQEGDEFPKEVCTKWFDYDRIGTNLVLRTRRPGDIIRLSQKGYTKKLKDYMIDSKIPRTQRDDIPVLAAGQEVLWLVGHRINDLYKVRPTTKKVLEVVYIKEEQP